MKRLNDTYLIAALMSKGFVPRERQAEKGVVYFLFDDEFAVNEAIDAYYSNNLMVKAQAYANMVRGIKAMIWETMKDGK